MIVVTLVASLTVMPVEISEATVEGVDVAPAMLSRRVSVIAVICAAFLTTLLVLVVDTVVPRVYALLSSVVSVIVVLHASSLTMVGLTLPPWAVDTVPASLLVCAMHSNVVSVTAETAASSLTAKVVT